MSTCWVPEQLTEVSVHGPSSSAFAMLWGGIGVDGDYATQYLGW